MDSNSKLTARIPIIPDSLVNKNQHKDKEIIFDDGTDDIYVKRGDQYINITGKIRDTVSEIQDGSCVIHVVTEETLPAVKDRPKNHWYFIVTAAEAYTNGEDSDTTAYIYYGVINDEYYKDKTYLLIAQNMILNPDVLHITCPAGYKICFYVPVEYSPHFSDEDTGEEIAFSIQDRLYCITPSNVTVSYDVYISDMEAIGDIYLRVDFTGTEWYTVTFDSNEPSVDGLEFATKELRVADGTVIGEVNDPIWTNPRYNFKGWSTTKTSYTPVDLTRYQVTENTTIYAYFEYDSDASKYTYKSVFTSSTGLYIGTFYGTASPSTTIAGRPYKGYTTPSTTFTLTKEGQVFNFTYDPIQYNITYQLDGGTISGQKTKYTIEEEYTPSTPTKQGGYTFSRWSPTLIKKGTTGDVTFKAIWSIDGIFIDGPELREQILGLYPNIETLATSIERSFTQPSDVDNAVNVSSNETDIYIWYAASSKTLMYYVKTEITCPDNMVGVFEGFSVLSDISIMSTWNINTSADISKMFKNCTHLSDLSALEGWKIESNFSETFLGTAAMNSGRVPNWYIWNCTIEYRSSQSDKLIATSVAKKVPNMEFYVDVTLTHYTYPKTPLTVTSNNQVLVVICTPDEWNIYYVLSDGIISGQKTSYTWEDVEAEAYTPPSPTKEGYIFKGWNPQNIPVNNVGDVTFVATWEEEASV